MGKSESKDCTTKPVYIRHVCCFTAPALDVFQVSPGLNVKSLFAVFQVSPGLNVKSLLDVFKVSPGLNVKSLFDVFQVSPGLNVKSLLDVFQVSPGLNVKSLFAGVSALMPCVPGLGDCPAPRFGEG